MIKYFAYGTNLDVEQMRNRCETIKVLGKGKLKNYRLIFNSRGVASIIPDNNSEVLGLVYELTKEGLNSLDSYEGYPSLYSRHEMRIESTEDTFINSIVYIAEDSKEGKPRPDHYECVLNALKKEDFPEEYIESFKLFFIL